jgi:flagellin-like protein
MKNKKALSAVITTVIMIALVLVAIGIVWAVVNGLISGNSENSEYASKCLFSGITLSSLDCSEDCQVSITRNAGSQGEEFDGVEVIFIGETEDQEIESPGDIITSKIVTSTLTSADSVEARVYFTNLDTLKNYYCDVVTSTSE